MIKKYLEFIRESGDPNIEIIRDAFYNLTDAYPLDIKFTIFSEPNFKFPSYLVEIKFNQKFCKIKTDNNKFETRSQDIDYKDYEKVKGDPKYDLLYDQSDVLKNIMRIIFESEAYLKDDFIIYYNRIVPGFKSYDNPKADNSIEIKLVSKVESKHNLI